MTKVFALLSVAAVLAFSSCAEKTAEVSSEDTLKVEVPADTTPVAPAPADTLAKDSAATTAPAAH
ncbi:hypothetical protein [Cytophaga hutchinsonii]|jgi:hypothetical protein|uniref:Uncharacterized protein n=1 Tax=Cytophaga hutchinsonii (strain ATCC 33406 / DSM 1761 / CIP 103989 / NBRC 15051 / NCIMB 9469 / D465) TaxID=269798 RepID=A0A6N4SV71_CYTH3|nr:hypothetical protein [Cytophaga hutchinsonii]ABG60312.1 hypothetical protein CHU_3072 [Cytophaga hutchinsonii ATCC 33406]SFX99088.1 hypothetical protein SAMN04487930_11732 [Cytophaga hutchinsonii ATCC 33406]